MSDDDQTGDGDMQRLARARLDRAATELDTALVARLRAARQRAVTATAERRPLRTTWWLPLSVTAAAVLAAVTGALLWSRPVPPLTAMTAATEDLEWLFAKEGPDFFSEQLEFYGWLEDENDAS